MSDVTPRKRGRKPGKSAREKLRDVPIFPLLTNGSIPPPDSGESMAFNSPELRATQKKMTELAHELGEGWPIEEAARRIGITVDQAHNFVRSDRALQARIFQLRGHPIIPEEMTPAQQLAAIKAETPASIRTIAMIRDNPQANLSTRLKAAETLASMNPDLQVAKKIDAEVVHRHVIELPKMDGMRAILEEVGAGNPALDGEFTEVVDSAIDETGGNDDDQS